MIDATVIYCSSNRENWTFEKRIIKHLLANCGGLPIVSVTQKPVNLGTNVCVGDIGVSGFNFFRQVQIACEQAKTKFVISAEADCLYPPDYFTYEPYHNNVFYRDTNLYVMGNHRSYFYRKPQGSTFAQIVGRETYLNRLKELFVGCPQWDAGDKNFPKGRHNFQDVNTTTQYFHTVNPCVSFKTGKGMRHHSATERVQIYSIPFWGDGKILRGRFYD